MTRPPHAGSYRRLAGLFADTDEATWLEARPAPLVGAESDGADSVGREESFTAWRRFLEGMAREEALRPRRRGSPLGRRVVARFPRAPPGLEHSGATVSPLHGEARALRTPPRRGWGKRNATTISLSPLTNEAASRLLQALLERSVLPAETRRCSSNGRGESPDAEQFARMLAERDDVVGSCLGTCACPRRCEARHAAARAGSLLHDAAVVGRVFWLGAAATIGERDRDAVRRDLNQLVHRESCGRCASRPSRVRTSFRSGTP